MHQVLSSEIWLIIEDETVDFLYELIETPNNFIQHIRRMAGGIILRISHGYTTQKDGRDPYVEAAEKAMAQLSLATTPGAFLVDFIPFCQSINIR